MRIAVGGIALLCAVAAAEARPRRGDKSGSMPLRVVIKDGAQSVANCVFSTGEVPESAPAGTPRRGSFDAGEPIWARCYLPARPGPSRPGDLVDVITIDGKPAWEQAYDHPLPSAALSRSVPYSDVLRTLLAALQPGAHRIALTGRLRRGGQRTQTLYRGDFRYVR